MSLVFGSGLRPLTANNATGLAPLAAPGGVAVPLRRGPLQVLTS